jgi:membrane protease YdiL (CAAX protease family)
MVTQRCWSSEFIRRCARYADRSLAPGGTATQCQPSFDHEDVCQLLLGLVARAGHEVSVSRDRGRRSRTVGASASFADTTGMTTALSTAKVCVPAIVVITPLVAAAWLPAGFPHLLRQLLLCGWGVGAILVAERLFFSDTLEGTRRAVGFVRARRSAIGMALGASLPMWAFLPLFAWMNGVAAGVKSGWLWLLLGVVLVNGITEEAIHRGFVFGHLRQGRSFAAAATSSALLFAGQHLYIIATTGWTIGLASVVLAVLLAYPLAFSFERGGNSIAGPAILHTSSNAPVIMLDLPGDFMATALLPHMAVIIVSLYVPFVGDALLAEKPRETRAGV